MMMMMIMMIMMMMMMMTIENYDDDDDDDGCFSKESVNPTLLVLRKNSLRYAWMFLRSATRKLVTFFHL